MDKLCGSAAGEDPFEGSIEAAEDFDAGFAFRFAKHSEHACQAESGVAADENCSTGCGREQISPGELTDIFGGDFDLGDVTDINQLRESRIEVRIGGKPLLMGENVRGGDGAGSGAEDQTILFFNSIESRHCAVATSTDSYRFNEFGWYRKVYNERSAGQNCAVVVRWEASRGLPFRWHVLVGFNYSTVPSGSI